MPPKVAAFQSGECESFNFTPDSQHFPFCSGRVPFNFHFAINFNLKGYEGGRGAWKVEGGRSRSGAYHCRTTKPQSPALALVNLSTRTYAHIQIDPATNTCRERKTSDLFGAKYSIFDWYIM